MREKLLQAVAPLKTRYEELNPREQAVLVLSGGLIAFLVLSVIGLLLSSSIANAERRITVKTSQLAEVVQLEGEYNLRKQERQRRLNELRRSNVSLVSVVEDAAKVADIAIGQIRPKQSEPNDEGVVEARVDLSATDLTINRLETFLSQLKNTRGLVIVRRLQLDRPYRSETLNLEMTITTYKMDAS